MRLWNTTWILGFNLRLVLNLYVQSSYIFHWYNNDPYFNIILNIIIATDPTFRKVLKIFIIFFSHHKFFVKIFFYHVTAIFTLFDHIINKIVNCIFTYVSLKRLTKLIINILAITTSNLFLAILDFGIYYFLALKYFQNLHKL